MGKRALTIKVGVAGNALKVLRRGPKCVLLFIAVGHPQAQKIITNIFAGYGFTRKQKHGAFDNIAQFAHIPGQL